VGPGTEYITKKTAAINLLWSFCVGSGSDRFGHGRRKTVRRRGNFRQVRAWKEKSCQKNGQLQTGLGVKVEKLSEEGVTSDRFGRGRRKAVRKMGNFRQVWV
jgi:hypothetical protein